MFRYKSQRVTFAKLGTDSLLIFLISTSPARVLQADFQLGFCQIVKIKRGTSFNHKLILLVFFLFLTPVNIYALVGNYRDTVKQLNLTPPMAFPLLQVFLFLVFLKFMNYQKRVRVSAVYQTPKGGFLSPLIAVDEFQIGYKPKLNKVVKVKLLGFCYCFFFLQKL